MTYALHEMAAADAMYINASGIQLRCTCCGAHIGRLPSGQSFSAASYDCSHCGFMLRKERGIWQALAPDRLAHFSRFIDEYQNIRAAEGRGSLQPDFYLNLPYKDVTGNNTWQWTIRTCTYAFLIRKLLPRLFPGRTNPPTVLDLGAGNGWMSYRLALAGYSPAAVDLLINDQDGLGAAVHFEKRLEALFPRFRAEMTSLPFADEQFDAVIFNASFHYAEDYLAVTREAMRCTKPEGVIIVADSPWYSASESGEQMVAERQAAFSKQYGTASDSIRSLEYLTDESLQHMENALSIRWERHTPYYGLKWAVRPLLAKFRGKREPSRFRVYSARKTA